MLLPFLFVVLVGYVLGALPFGYLVARAKGVDIFAVGSCNPGATNVRRVLGHGPGNLVLGLDALKGYAAAWWPLIPSMDYFGGWHPVDLQLAGMISAVLGHSFSCFTKFKGGKGVATGAGGFLAIVPLGLGIAAAIWGLVFMLTRYVSLASMLAAITLAAVTWMIDVPLAVSIMATLVAVFVIVRHCANIGRLIAGTESKAGKKPKAGPPTSSSSLS